MKSLSLSRPLVIVVIGLPGSGKSFFSRQFADMFNAPLVNVDFIRNAVFPQPEFSPTEDAIVYTVAQNEVNELFKTGKTFIIDGGVNNKASRHNIERQAVHSGYGRLTIWVQTDDPTCIARSMKRSTKRPGDDLNMPMDRQSFERYRKQLNIPSVRENVVVISGKHTFSSQARIVLKKLVSPRETVPQPRDVAPITTEQKVDTTHDIQPRRRNLTVN
jgi:predicted kinase